MVITLACFEFKLKNRRKDYPQSHLVIMCEARGE